MQHLAAPAKLTTAGHRGGSAGGSGVGSTASVPAALGQAYENKRGAEHPGGQRPFDLGKLRPRSALLSQRAVVLSAIFSPLATHHVQQRFKMATQTSQMPIVAASPVEQEYVLPSLSQLGKAMEAVAAVSGRRRSRCRVSTNRSLPPPFCPIAAKAGTAGSIEDLPNSNHNTTCMVRQGQRCGGSAV